MLGSGSVDWVCLYFFAIIVDGNSSHIELLLNDVCLTNLCEESLTISDCCLTAPFEFTNALPFISATRPV
jgi:hypothetical protein